MEILSATYIISSPTIEVAPIPNRPEYAFIGRSNVGKSSLINLICNKTHLAKTSSAPGKTKLINHFGIQSTGGATKRDVVKWYLVDLPGYGYAKVSQRERVVWQKMIENYLRQRKNLQHIFVLIDARRQPQEIDLEFVQQLNAWQLPFSLVFTKIDKEKTAVIERNVAVFKETLLLSQQFLPRQFLTSAEKKIGREELLVFIAACNKNYKSE